MVGYILALSNRNERSFIIWNNLFPPTTLTFLSAWIPFIGHLTVSWHFDVLFIVEKHLFASAKFQILFLKNTQKQKTQNFMKRKLFQCLKHPVWDLANHSVMREAFCYRCPYIMEIGHPNRTGGRRLACLNRDLLWDQEKKKRGFITFVRSGRPLWRPTKMWGCAGRKLEGLSPTGAISGYCC